MALENSIRLPGADVPLFEFIAIVGTFLPTSEQLEVFSRKGQRGVTVRKTNERPRPFQIQTRHFVADRQAANDAISAYLDLKDGADYEWRQAGQYMGVYQIIELVESNRRAVGPVVGGLFGNEEIQQLVTWTLLHVPIPQEG